MEEVLISFVTEEMLKKLVSLAAKEFVLAWGLTGELNNLKESLTMIQAVLQDAEKRQVRDEAVKLWLRKLKDVAFDADDALDDFEYEILRKERSKLMSKVCNFFSLSNPIVFHFKMAHRVREVNMSLDRLKAEVAGFGLNVGPIGVIPQINLDRTTHSFLAETKVVGRGTEKSKIVAMLLESSSTNKHVISVLPIVGMAGLGKTTLAQLVYNNSAVKKHFGASMWVCVSEPFDVEKILREMHESLTRSKVVFENLDTLVRCLKEELKDKRYFLVLDDMWNEDDQKWGRLKDSLLAISDCKGNCIITTSRSDKVASIVGTLPRQNLGILSEEECWSIFKRKALGDEDDFGDRELESIGLKIVKKCRGVPLVASVLGGTLRYKEKVVWLSIQNSELWSLDDDNIDKMLGILKLSYDYLPSSSLKQCFSYCAVFPKDFVFEKEKLVQIWMAQGFFQPFQSKMVAEDVGDMFFDILLANSLFQDVRKDKYGNVISCKMHDVVHDLALSISHIRHLFCDRQSVERISKDSFRKMRSLISDKNPCMSSDLKCVHVLKCPDFFEGISISKMKHLRYLETSKSRRTLPDLITKLYHLQTLRLEECYFLEELPRNLGGLSSLQHIYVYDWDLLPSSNFEKIPFLILGKNEGHRIEEWGVHKINKLKGELTINKLEWLDKGDAKKVNLGKNISIVKLSYKWSEDRDGCNDDVDVLENLLPPQNLEVLTIENFGGKKFPSWVMMQEKLVELKLIGCKKCEEIPVVANLPRLKILVLSGLKNVKCLGTEFYGAIGGSNTIEPFPALKTLILKEMSNLKEWVEAPQVPGGQQYAAKMVGFSRLKNLSIEECPLLTFVPLWSRFSALELRHEGCNARHEALTCKFEYNNSLFQKGFNWKLNEESVSATLVLSSIRRLEIRWCTRLTSLPSWVRSCTSLESLSIINCNQMCWIMEDLGELNSLIDLEVLDNFNVTCFTDESLGRLTRLRRLKIGGFSEELEDFPGVNCIQHLCASLKDLEIYGWEKLKSLPQQLQYLNALTKLHLLRFNGLEALPEWLGNLSSLQELRISLCKNLKHLPSEEALGRLSKLQAIWISSCPYLEDRCTAKDWRGWSKIANIPRITMQEATI